MNNIESPTKVALYIRVSTDAQREEGYSIEAQKEALTGYCMARSFKNYEFYIDGGYSGSNLNRPEITRLISDAQNHKIKKCIVIQKTGLQYIFIYIKRPNTSIHKPIIQ